MLGVEMMAPIAANSVAVHEDMTVETSFGKEVVRMHFVNYPVLLEMHPTQVGNSMLAHSVSALELFAAIDYWHHLGFANRFGPIQFDTVVAAIQPSLNTTKSLCPRY